MESEYSFVRGQAVADFSSAGAALWVPEISGQPAPGQDAPSHQVSETALAERTQTLKNAVSCDLIMTLMQKKVLTEREGKDLLRKLFV
jgi:hypothetical protein